ncbi:hypothetical protein EJ02DRAFT_361197 [Clathrospora elynae]|uniref:Integrase zinc-binding domain-containing protein n=1 Tax=Clathrospora elynae TaxID=706981 RepID=A0A6A5S7J4_9PLEO|nr:hypothetical protein EJ02DRAFT_361197 [Clathrospora elynae]
MQRVAGKAKDITLWEVDPSGILRWNGKVWIPKAAALCANILMHNHDDPMGGHYSIEKIAYLLKMKY